MLELGCRLVLATDDATLLKNQLKEKLGSAGAKELLEILATTPSTETKDGAVLLEKLESRLDRAARTRLLQLFSFVISNEETIKSILVELSE